MSVGPAGTLVDSNVLLDIVTDDPRWAEWSAAELAAAARRGPLIINPVIYAEVSVGFNRIEDLDDALDPGQFRRDTLPWTAGFLAGKAFLAYRKRGGARGAPLPDFFIGAHAAVTGLALLTRDGARYHTYFPTVRLIAP
jgi:predicted nucleic acid-binding protein